MLKGKTVVVLGGSAGIGLAVAEAAARDGARVIIASSHQARVDAALTRVRDGQGHAVDLRSEAAVRGLSTFPIPRRTSADRSPQDCFCATRSSSA